MSSKSAVQVTIGGEDYTVRSELPPEYTREVAAYVDAALRRVRDTVPMVETHKAAILAALAITDELFQGRRGDREAAARLNTLTDEISRLLPPQKRGRRGNGTSALEECANSAVRLRPRVRHRGFQCPKPTWFPSASAWSPDFCCPRPVSF
ncbi:MAG: cell division protein ZapA [Gemmatimonadales bacterium]